MSQNQYIILYTYFYYMFVHKSLNNRILYIVIIISVNIISIICRFPNKYIHCIIDNMSCRVTMWTKTICSHLFFVITPSPKPTTRGRDGWFRCHCYSYVSNLIILVSKLILFMLNIIFNYIDTHVCI